MKGLARGAVLVVLLLTSAARSALAASFAYVTNSLDQTVSIIDTVARTVVATVPVGANPRRPMVHPDGRSAYVVTDTDDLYVEMLSVIDTATNTVAGTMRLPPRLNLTAVHPDGKHFLVVDGFRCPSEVFVLDIDTLSMEAAMPVGCYPGP